MADSPDQRQPKLQKGTHFTNEMKEHVPYKSKKQGFNEATIPNTTGYALWRASGYASEVRFGGMLRGLWKCPPL